MHINRLLTAALTTALAAGLVVAATPAATAADSVPTAPQSVSVLGGIDKATASWEPPADPGSSDVVKYTITVSPGDRVIEVGPDARSVVIGGLTINPWYQYSFSVRAHNATGASSAVTRTLRHTSLSVHAPSPVAYGDIVILIGYFTLADGTPLANEAVQMKQRKTGTTTWSHVSTRKTSDTGSYNFGRTPSRNMDYRIVYQGSTKFFGTISRTITVKVKPEVTGGWSDGSIRAGQSSVFRGSVAPNHAGKRIYLQRYYDGKWHTNTTVYAKLTSESKYRFPRQFKRKGTFYFRAYLPSHDDHAAAASPKRRIVVS